MSDTMMACGHTAQATKHNRDGSTQPACVICDCYEVDDSPPDLTGRMARCGYFPCDSERPSSRSLPFFEYRGPGSMDRKCRNCGYFDTAHEEKKAGAKHLQRNVCDDFTPRTEGRPTDSFYCGCRGWD